MTANNTPWPQSLIALATQHPCTLVLTSVPGPAFVAELRVPGVGTYTSTAEVDPVRAVERVFEMMREVVGE